MTVVGANRQGNVITITGLQSMCESDFEATLKRVLEFNDVNGDTVFRIHTRGGVEEWSWRDLTNSLGRKLLYQRI